MLEKASTNIHYKTSGKTCFEIANHLGNIVATISDRKKANQDLVNPQLVTHYSAHIQNAQDYFPFGMIMPGRSVQDLDNTYRYGFQNQETDKELWDGAVSYKYRIEDPRLGRFFSVDPLTPKYPHNSTYAFSENRVIDGVELEGLECVLNKDVEKLKNRGDIILHVADEYVVAEYRYNGYYLLTAIMEDGITSEDVKSWNPFFMPKTRRRIRTIGKLCETALHEKFICKINPYNFGHDLFGVDNSFRHLLGYTLSVFVNGLDKTQIIFDGHERFDEDDTLQPWNDDFVADIINNEIATEIAFIYENQFTKTTDVTRENVAAMMNEILCRVMEQFYQSEVYLLAPEQYIESYKEFSSEDEIVNNITLFLKERLPNE